MNKDTRTYPYKAWVLQPSFKPVEVEFAKPYVAFDDHDYGDLSLSGKLVARGDIHSSKAEAIATGWKRVEKQTADLEKKLASLDKKRVALRKAEGGV